MRYLLSVSIVAAVIVLGLQAYTALRPDTPVVKLLAIATPDSVYSGERVTIFGGLQLPAGRFELGLWNCLENDCHRHLWKTVEGPGDVWGSLGSVEFERGPGAIVLRVFRLDGVSDSAVATWSRAVAVIGRATSNARPSSSSGAHAAPRRVATRVLQTANHETNGHRVRTRRSEVRHAVVE